MLIYAKYALNTSPLINNTLSPYSKDICDVKTKLFCHIYYKVLLPLNCPKSYHDAMYKHVARVKLINEINDEKCNNGRNI